MEVSSRLPGNAALSQVYDGRCIEHDMWAVIQRRNPSLSQENYYFSSSVAEECPRLDQAKVPVTEYSQYSPGPGQDDPRYSVGDVVYPRESESKAYTVEKGYNPPGSVSWMYEVRRVKGKKDDEDSDDDDDVNVWEYWEEELAKPLFKFDDWVTERGNPQFLGQVKRTIWDNDIRDFRHLVLNFWKEESGLKRSSPPQE